MARWISRCHPNASNCRSNRRRNVLTVAEVRDIDLNGPMIDDDAVDHCHCHCHCNCHCRPRCYCYCCGDDAEDIDVDAGLDVDDVADLMTRYRQYDLEQDTRIRRHPVS